MATYMPRHRAYKKRQACQRKIEQLGKDLESLQEEQLNLVLGLHKKREGGIRKFNLNYDARQLFEILGNGLGDLEALKDEIVALESDPYAREKPKMDLVTPVPLMHEIPLEPLTCPKCRKAGFPVKCDNHWFSLHLEQLNAENPQVSVHYVGTMLPLESWDLELNYGKKVYTCYDMLATNQFYVIPERLKKSRGDVH